MGPLVRLTVGPGRSVVASIYVACRIHLRPARGRIRMAWLSASTSAEPILSVGVQLNTWPYSGDLALPRRPDRRQSLIFSFPDWITFLHCERDLHEHSNDNSGSPYQNERFSRNGVSLDGHTIDTISQIIFPASQEPPDWVRAISLITFTLVATVIFRKRLCSDPSCPLPHL